MKLITSEQIWTKTNDLEIICTNINKIQCDPHRWPWNNMHFKSNTVSKLDGTDHDIPKKEWYPIHTEERMVPDIDCIHLFHPLDTFWWRRRSRFDVLFISILYDALHRLLEKKTNKHQTTSVERNAANTSLQTTDHVNVQSCSVIGRAHLPENFSECISRVTFFPNEAYFAEVNWGQLTMSVFSIHTRSFSSWPSIIVCGMRPKTPSSSAINTSHQLSLTCNQSYRNLGENWIISRSKTELPLRLPVFTTNLHDCLAS